MSTRVVLGGVVAVLAALLALASPASAARTTTINAKAPTAGDITYAVAQVKIGKKGRAGKLRKGTKVLKTRAGGVNVVVSSKQWKKLRRNTSIHVIASKVAGASPKVRNVALYIIRWEGGKFRKSPATFKFRFTNATPVKGSFWVRKVTRNGSATVFTAPNALSNAVDNWGRYIAVLKAADAVSAALRPVDVNGTFEPYARRASARISQSTPVKTYKGGHKMKARTKKMFNLIYGTIGDRLKYQAAKRDPAVTDFISKQLKNPKLAKRWEEVAAELPLKVPDKYAANAQEEAKHGVVSRVRISRNRVVFADGNRLATASGNDDKPGNSTETAGGHMGGFVITPSIRLVVAKDGSGTVSSDVLGISCGSRCEGDYASGEIIKLTAKPSPASTFVSWAGCDEVGGLVCTVKANATKADERREVKVVFRGVTPGPGGGGPGGPGGPQGGYTTFGSNLQGPADLFESHQQDSVFWNTAFAGGGLPTAPADGQIVEVTIKGATLRAENGADPLNNIAIQVLKPQPDGVMMVPAQGGSSLSSPQDGDFKIPVDKAGDGSVVNPPDQTFTRLHPVNLCIAKGDSVGMNTQGGWDNTNPGDRGYFDGVPFQVFSHATGSSNEQFHKHDGTGNGARLENGVNDDYETQKEPVTRPEQELLMQVRIAFGDERSFPCGGKNRNAG